MWMGDLGAAGYKDDSLCIAFLDHLNLNGQHVSVVLTICHVVTYDFS